MKSLLVFFGMALASHVFAQPTDDFIHRIKGSGEYYYGAGLSSENADQARDSALSELLSQISVTVSSMYHGKLKEVNGKVEQSAELAVKTHSIATLNNVKRTDRKVSEGIEVFLYIKKNEVEKIFEERKKLICELCTRAREMEGEKNFGYALKWYYFAGILLNSIPDPTVIYNGINITTELPHRINDILLNTDFAFVRSEFLSSKERRVALNVTCRDTLVTYIEFTFWDGTSQVAVSAKDGEAIVDLIGESVRFDRLDLNIKYAFYECRQEIREVADLWDVVIMPSFTVGKKQVNLRQPQRRQEKPAPLPGESLVTTTDGISLGLNNKDNCPVPVLNQVRSETLAFIRFLQSGKADSYAGDPFLAEKLRRFMEYNHPMLAGISMHADVNKTNDGWEVRKIGVLNRYRTINNKQEPESIILDCNEGGKLQDVNYAITSNLYQSFVEQAVYGKDWGNRQIILKFIERYRTAYLNRDIQTIGSIFSDNAVIIVGREVKTQAMKSDAIGYQPLTTQPKYEYLRFKKNEYIERQKSIFRTQKDIFLGFSTFKIMKHSTTDGVYGVSMRQNYTSTTYADEGHLFLYIDFNEKLPLIYVRAWQPQEWNQDAIVNISNFKIFK